MNLRTLTPLKVGSVWTPLQLPNLLAWYSAKQGITLNGSTVSQWNDLSGNGRHLTQAVASSQPTYNATGLNSKPTCYFDGSGDYMTYVGAALPTYQNFTVWMVLKQVNNSNYDVVWFAPSNLVGQTGDAFLEVRNGATDQLDIWVFNAGPSAGSGAGTFTGGGIYRLLTYGDGSTLSLDINAVNKIAFSSSGRFIGDTFTFPSFRYLGYTVYDLECYISEIIVTTATPTAQDKADLEAWYTSQWA